MWKYIVTWEDGSAYSKQEEPAQAYLMARQLSCCNRSRIIIVHDEQGRMCHCWTLINNLWLSYDDSGRRIIPS